MANLVLRSMDRGKRLDLRQVRYRNRIGATLAVIVLDRMRGSGAAIGSRAWWVAFIPVFLIIAGLDVSSLITEDAITATGLTTVVAPGMTLPGLSCCVAAAAMAGFIFATAKTGIAHKQGQRGALQRRAQPHSDFIFGTLQPCSPLPPTEQSPARAQSAALHECFNE